MQNSYFSIISKDSCSYTVIYKSCFFIIYITLKIVVGNVINKNGKNHYRVTSEEKIIPNTYLKERKCISCIAKLKSFGLKENPATQSYIINTFIWSMSVVNTIVNSFKP